MKAKEQEIELFEEIFNLYHLKAKAFALGLIKDNSTVEEIVQNVFLQVWQDRKKLVKNKFLNYYIFRLVHEEICRFFKHNVSYGGNRNHELEPLPEYEYKIGPETYLNELQGILDKSIEQMPEQRR